MIKQAAGVLVQAEGKVLGFQHLMKNPGCIGIPGGKLEGNETPAEAAIRECLEETGHFVEILDMEPYVDLSSNGQFVMHVFLAEIVATTEPSHPEEGIEAWITPETLANDSVYGEFNTKMLAHFGVL